MPIDESVILKLEKLAKLKLEQDEQAILMKDIKGWTNSTNGTQTVWSLWFI